MLSCCIPLLQSLSGETQLLSLLVHMSYQARWYHLQMNVGHDNIKDCGAGYTSGRRCRHAALL